jgi:hypothetical protein
MTYSEIYNNLKQIYDPAVPHIVNPVNKISIHNLPFVSESWSLLPGAEQYKCEQHNLYFSEQIGWRKKLQYDEYPDVLKNHDLEIEENRKFTYTVFRKEMSERADDIILLFHGLNEKTWHKYLPWAEKLVENTGKTVVLFPIAFHMNRLPAEWSNPRMMSTISKIRQKHSLTIANTTFANAAISARIQAIPQRFFWSGLQTFFDVVQLLNEIHSGNHKLIKPGAGIDLFSYSIGSFLSEILLMANPDNYFSNSRLFLFCGGPTLDRMQPNSKYILDSDATIAIISFYTERLDMELKHDNRMGHFFNGEHPAGNYFKAMLNYHKEKNLREQRFRAIKDQLCAVPLRKDTVIQPCEVENTLKGENRDIPVKIDILDFPYPYDHVTPFPTLAAHEQAVTDSFNQVFELVGSFLK